MKIKKQKNKIDYIIPILEIILVIIIIVGAFIEDRITHNYWYNSEYQKLASSLAELSIVAVLALIFLIPFNIIKHSISTEKNNTKKKFEISFKPIIIGVIFILIFALTLFLSYKIEYDEICFGLCTPYLFGREIPTVFFRLNGGIGSTCGGAGCLLIISWIIIKIVFLMMNKTSQKKKTN